MGRKPKTRVTIILDTPLMRSDTEIRNYIEEKINNVLASSPKDRGGKRKIAMLMHNTIIRNMEGVGNMPTTRRIKNMVNQHQVEILGILEPMIKETNITTTTHKLSFNNYTNNGEVDGKIWVF